MSDVWKAEAHEWRRIAERLRASLQELFLLAQMSDQIRNDCPQMRKAGKLLGEQAKAKGLDEGGPMYDQENAD